jgi:hypothetical protein
MAKRLPASTTNKPTNAVNQMRNSGVKPTNTFQRQSTAPNANKRNISTAWGSNQHSATTTQFKPKEAFTHTNSIT